MTASKPTSLPIFGTNKLNTFIAAFVAASVFTVVFSYNAMPHNAGGFLHSTDDMVRMVIVRDWLAGQSWFDPILHRLGFEPGTVMHWSRLIDAPIGLLIWIGGLFGNGEHFAAYTWPFITFVAALAGILTSVRRASGSGNVIPALIIGGFGLWSWGAFQSGVIDHHNAQTALGMWLVASVLPSHESKLNFTLAAILMALMLAIGIESVPFAIAGALAILARLIGEREALYEPVRRFGLTLAVAITTLFFLLLGPQNYHQTYCDSLSLFHLLCAGTGGILLYIGLHPSLRAMLPAPALTVPSIAGAMVVLVAVVFFPQCLADPVAGIDPVLRHYWLDYIMEAQNVFKVARLDPWLLLYQYALTVIAFGVLAWQCIMGQHRVLNVLLLIFLLITTAVTLFQMRGIQQSGPVAGLILSIVVTRFMHGTGKTKPLAGLIALIVCCNLFWKLGVMGGMALFAAEPGPLMNQSKAEIQNICRTPDDLATLDAEKPGFIAAANGLGAWLLFATDHRVLAGPYHRNNAGNLAAVNIMIGTPEQAHQIMKDRGITLFAACPQFVDEQQILREVPNGFLGQVLGGKKVEWLEPIDSTMGKPLKLWRVRG